MRRELFYFTDPDNVRPIGALVRLPIPQRQKLLCVRLIPGIHTHIRPRQRY